MTVDDEVSQIKILLGALSTHLAKADPQVKAHLCMELVKAQDASTLTKQPSLAAAFDQWIDILDCKKVR